MTNEYIINEIKKAKDSLDSVNDPRIGFTGFDICDGILTNLKIYVTDEKIYAQIIQFEEKLLKDYRLKQKESREKLKGLDMLTQYSVGEYHSAFLKNWKSTELLNLWTRIIKDYDLQVK